MADVCVTETINAPASDVWALLRNFTDVSAWAPKAEIFEHEGEGKGALRRVRMPMGEIYERCEMHDDAAQRFSYRLLESPWPFEDYLATVSLAATNDNACEITWACDMKAPEEMLPALKQEVELTYRKGFINALRKAAEN
jgi:activator of HSP90 ATPase